MKIGRHTWMLTTTFAMSLATYCFGQVNLIVKETSGFTRTNEFIHNGIPISKATNFIDISALTLKDSKGRNVEAQFEVLARWGGGLNSKAPIKWLLVTFPASVNAKDSATYILSNGSPAPAKTPLTVQEDANAITINTGAAKFKISKSKFNIFEEASLSTNPSTSLLGGAGGNATITVLGKPTLIAGAPEEVKLEHVGELFVTIKVTGHFDNIPFGVAKWKYVARYSFYAGGTSAEVDFGFSFPGNKSGTLDNSRPSLEIAGQGELVKITNVKISLPLTTGGNEKGVAKGDAENQILMALGSDKFLRLEQKLREKMISPPAYSIIGSGNPQKTGKFAETPMVGITGTKGSVAASFQLMRFYEPQAMVGYANKLELHLVSDSQWVSPFSGGCSKFSISLAQASPNWDSLTTQSLNALDRQLLAWPEREYIAKSMVLEEIWDGKPNALAQIYWDKLSSVTKNTREGYVKYGMFGFMTYGLTPRYWFDNLYGNEFGNVNTWDGYFLEATFSDYHNAFANVVLQFAQSKESSLLHELAYPAARRMLHTMIVQGEPNSKNFFVGWAGTGYGAYRKNLNSSHSYFENLYYYYYLTGDRQVLDVLLPGAKKLRNSYARRLDGSLVPSTEQPIDPTSATTSRVGSQFGSISLFLGHASEDSTYLGDFLNRYDRMADRYMLLLNKNGKEYAFFNDDTLTANPHEMITSQSWMFPLYDMQNLWELYKEFGDVKLGKTGIAISRYYLGVYNTYWDYIGKILDGTATSEGKWANQITVKWTGDRIGGTVTSVTAVTTGEPVLYPATKGILTAFMFRAALMNKSQSMYDQSSKFLGDILKSFNKNMAWSKEASEFYLRMHSAVGLNASGLFGNAKVSSIRIPDKTTPEKKPKDFLTTEVDMFKQQVSITYYLKIPDTVRLGIFSTSGQLIKELVSNKMEQSGDHKVIWNCTNSNGVYVKHGPYILEYRIGADTRHSTLILR